MNEVRTAADQAFQFGVLLTVHRIVSTKKMNKK